MSVQFYQFQFERDPKSSSLRARIKMTPDTQVTTPAIHKSQNSPIVMYMSSSLQELLSSNIYVYGVYVTANLRNQIHWFPESLTSSENP